MTNKKSDSTAALNNQILTLKAQLAQAEISNIGRDICTTFRNDTEVYFHEDNLSGKSDGWRQIDTMDKSEYILTFNMQSELAKLQQAYKEDQGRSFTTIKPTQIDGDLPEDIATLMLEMNAMDAANNPEKEEVAKAS